MSVSKTTTPFFRSAPSVSAVTKVALILLLWPACAQAFLPAPNQHIPVSRYAHVSVKHATQGEVVRELEGFLHETFSRVHISPPDQNDGAGGGALTRPGRMQSCAPGAHAFWAGGNGVSVQGCVHASKAHVRIALQLSSPVLQRWQDAVCGLASSSQWDAEHFQRSLVSRFATERWRHR